MATVNITVDGTELEAQAGQMLIEVTDQAGIHIPRFCYHPKLSIAANCRMCLVEVERAPKPLPACATPVMDGMVVQTQSTLAKTAQEGTMEFLLINHPLDCPICDQGGECPLQDQSVGYGKNDSRYQEAKRQVESKNIGPLIATWMTRCIHCTRCVRFGEEIGGVMELGMIGRGEHSSIATFPGAKQDDESELVNGALSANDPNRFVKAQSSEHQAVDAYLSSSVNSELSGNVIELCPVGALTAKPSKYAGRSWELQSHASVSPHDCVGSNLNVQTLRGEIKRTVVRDNDRINSCWLSDRDRYSYESALSDNRLTKPMIKDQHGWREVDWDAALKQVATGLKTVINRSGEESIGVLATPAASVEEHFLIQKLMRGLGSSNIDHRLQQQDFRGDFQAPAYPGSELEINQFEKLDNALLIGSNIRKEQPILGLYLRQANVKNNAKLAAINSVDYDFHFGLQSKSVVAPHQMVTALASVAEALADHIGIALDADIAERSEITDEAKAIAQTLLSDGESKAIIFGSSAMAHAEMCSLLAIGDWIAELIGAKVVRLPQGNAAGAWLAGCVPHRGPHSDTVAPTGLNAKRMISENESLRAYVLYGVEPGLDMHRSGLAQTAMEQADFVVQCSAFISAEAMNYADVLLPIAHNAEQSGTYINCVGAVQESRAAASPAGEARPGWKVLRVMGNYLKVEGFDHVTIEDVQDDYVLGFEGIIGQRGMGLKEIPDRVPEGSVQRICETPMYRVDQSVRYADALQSTADNPAPGLGLNAATMSRLGLAAGNRAHVRQGDAQIELDVVLDSRLPDDCAFVPAGHVQTAALAGLGQLQIESCA